MAADAASDSVEAVLQLAIDLYGPSLLDQPDRLRRYLEKRCPDSPFDVSLLLIALEEEVGQELLRVRSNDELQRLVPLLEARLAERRGLNALASTWAVATWAKVLWMDTEALSTPPDATRREPPTAPPPVRVAVRETTAPSSPSTTRNPGPEERAPPVPTRQGADRPVDHGVIQGATASGVRGNAVHRPAGRWAGVVGVLSALGIAAVATHFALPDKTPAKAPLESPRIAPAAQAPSLRKAPSSVPAPSSAGSTIATTTPPLRISDVASDEPLLGDGSAHQVFVTIDAAPGNVRWIEAQFLRGDGPWESQARVVDVEHERAPDGRIAVGSIGLRTTVPATATFQYVLRTADGRHSAPFVKEFTFVPVPALAPTIVSVAVQGTAVGGRAPVVEIVFRDGDRPVAAVEAAPIDPVTSGGGAVAAIPVSRLSSPRPGTLVYPLDRGIGPSRTTMAFVLVDRDGLRSEARQVVVQETAPPIRQAPTACPRDACGSVVAVRDAAASASNAPGSPAAQRRTGREVIVRLDDRTIHTLVAPGTWRVGSRVRLVGDRLVPVDARISGVGRASSQSRLIPESAPGVQR